MSILAPINLAKFIEENKDQLKPPVNNKVIWKDAELMVMLLAAPTNGATSTCTPRRRFSIRSRATAMWRSSTTRENAK